MSNKIKGKLIYIIIVNIYSSFFQANVRSQCAINLFQVLDAKIGNDCYSSQFACSDLEVSKPKKYLKYNLILGESTKLERKSFE